MAKDPLGLFPEVEKPQLKTQSSGPGFLATLLIVVVVFAGAFAWQKLDFGGGDKQDQKHEHVIGNKIPATDTWVFVAEETEDRTNHPFLADLYSDADLWGGFDARGTKKLHWFDADASAIKSYMADYQQIGLPVLMVVSSSGKVALSVKCPETREAVIEAVNKVMQ